MHFFTQEKMAGACDPNKHNEQLFASVFVSYFLCSFSKTSNNICLWQLHSEYFRNVLLTT